MDIATIHPDEIRTRLSIIPQDVHLFSMTVRENLDPSGYYSDLELWNCLELAQLKEFFNTKMPQGLGMYVCKDLKATCYKQLSFPFLSMGGEYKMASG